MIEITIDVMLVLLIVLFFGFLFVWVLWIFADFTNQGNYPGSKG